MPEYSIRSRVKKNKIFRIDKRRLYTVFMIILCTFIFLFLPFNIMAEDKEIAGEKKVRVKGDNIQYISAKKSAKISGNVKGVLGKYHFQAEEVKINFADKNDGFLTIPENLKMAPGSFSGCDLDNPHYLFKAKKIVIKPNHYLKAYHAIFYELNGRLPLFYLPYIYIDLSDDRQKLVPEFGYSSQRGWYGKLTYNHRLIEDLPGQLYLGYYQKTGEVYGFKQHYLYTPHHKAYLYYYNQKNNINLKNLAEKHWETGYDFEKNNWRADLLLNYKTFYDYNRYNGDLKIVNEKEKQTTSFDAEYDKFDYPDKDRDRLEKDIRASFDRDFADDLSIELDYDLDEREYISDLITDDKEINLDLSVNKSFANDLDLSLDYFRELDYDGDDDLSDEIEAELGLDYSWAESWSYELDYEYGELRETEENMKTRESGKTVLAYSKNDLELNTILERHEPNFTEEDEKKVSYYRLPEFNLKYTPHGSFSYRVQLGNYYEDESKTEGYRGGAEIEYQKSITPFKAVSFSTTQTLIGRAYKPREVDLFYYDPYQLIYESDLGMKNRLTDRLELSNNYKLTFYRGKSPFEFDQAEISEVVESKLNYKITKKVNFRLESGYDIHNKEYLPLTADLRYIPLAGWVVKAALEYDINQALFSENLKISSNYSTEKLEADTSLDYNLNESRISLLENTLTYEIKGDWGWYIENNISYDFEEDPSERLEEADLTVKKRLHCREIRLSYDYLSGETRLTYQINLLPEQGIEVGKDGEGEFLLKLGKEEVK